jgi:anaerobic selenocysteine-containing dehydrogenase
VWHSLYSFGKANEQERRNLMKLLIAALATATALAAAQLPTFAHGGASDDLQYTPPYSSICTPSPVPCPDYANSQQ